MIYTCTQCNGQPVQNLLYGFCAKCDTKDNNGAAYAKSRNTSDFADLWQEEFYDVYDILQMGAKKYKIDGWLDEDGHGTSHKEMHDSMFHHLAQSYAKTRLDDESQLDHLLHVACRALMLYTRLQRGLINPKDIQNS